MKSKNVLRAYFVLFFCVVTMGLHAQDQPFYKEITDFKKTDSGKQAPKNTILFVGSSSFTKWTDVQQYFPGYPILNRGFGGSSLPDLIRYVNDIIIPYHPRQIFIYCGENDIAASDTVTASLVFERYKTLHALIRAGLPHTPIVFISIKPSPSRWKFEQVIVETNKKIEQFLRTQQNALFLDVHHAMLNKDGSVNTELFISDQLHMNAKGYAIWQKIILPELLK